jgi:hypothetical protein
MATERKKLATAKSKKRKAVKPALKPKASGSKEVCFVIMPFGGWLDDYYLEIYCPAVRSAGLEPHRADDLFRPSTIVNDIWDYTKKARLLVADLTGKNPNVFYELGLAHAIRKPVILLAESMDDIPFDLRALRIIIYDKNKHDWGAKLMSDITSSISEVLAAPQNAVLPAFLNVSGVQSAPTVSPHQKELLEIRQDLDLLKREIRDESPSHRSRHLDIGPAEARRLIANLVKKGAPLSVILNSVAPLGPPESWIRDTAREFGKSKRSLNRAASEKGT